MNLPHLQRDWSVGPSDTINDVLRRAASEHGDKPFLDVLGEQYRYADIQREACRLANGLRALGVEKGHTVATILDNSFDAVVLWLAINKCGAISVPVNTAYKGEFLRHQLADADASVIVAEHDYAERVALVAGDLVALKTLVYRGSKPNLPQFQRQLLPIDEIRSSDSSDPMVEVSPSDLAMLVYTGGTTGPSKGCMISHNYACNQARQMHVCLGRHAGSYSWTPLPMFHSNAVITTFLCNMMLGARVALYPRFSVSNFWQEIERTGANEVSLLGSMFPLLAKAADNDAMKRCHGQLQIVTGAPFPPDLQAIWRERFGMKAVNGACFGLTECAVVTLTPFGEPQSPNSAGRINEWFDIRIVDDHDVELPPNTPGELMVRPLKPHVMFEGYWKRPADTLKVMRNMWFHTGDIGKIDDQGFFYFLDRKKDYLRRGGENISSFEMEKTFQAHDAIEEVAVHAVYSELSEDEVKVTAVLRPGYQLDERALCTWATDRLPYFAVPRYIEFVKELPRNPVGRILKYQLRDIGVTPATWDRIKAGFELVKR
jgi:crotonobetaine/carnitine-CoA ligase